MKTKEIEIYLDEDADFSAGIDFRRFIHLNKHEKSIVAKLVIPIIEPKKEFTPSEIRAAMVLVRLDMTIARRDELIMPALKELFGNDYDL